jgi:tetratricopeptide (TPR) repeat protein
MGVLDDIRRAAFELRQEDPKEAVRVLRRAAQQGGEAEVLARGALGEIYLEDYEDLDGAEHEFRRVLQLAPGLTAAEIGLARTRQRAGDGKGAETAYVRALTGLSRDVRAFRESETLPAGAEEVVLTLMETAVELAELRKGAVPLDEEILAWAAAEKLFDTEEEGRDDWVRFHALWTRLRILTARPEEAVTALREAERTGELPANEAKELLRLALKELGEPEVVQIGKKS